MINPFDKISSKNKEKLLWLLESKEYSFPKKTSIAERFKNENIVGIIEEGYIKVYRNNYDGSTNTIEELYENEVFTTTSSLTNKDIDIITMEDSQIIIVDYDYIVENLDNDTTYFNQFIKNLFLIMNDKIISKNERIEILSKKTIRGKLLQYFDIEYNKRKSKYIYLPFTFKDLAEYLCIDRTAMSRELRYLKEDGFIETKGKRITLLNK